MDGYIKLKINRDLVTKYFVDLKKDYTNIYLPYTKEVTSKYSMRLYEYLRSYLYMNAKTKGTPTIAHPNDLKNLKIGQAYVKILLPSSNQYVDKIDIQNYIDE